MEEQELFKEGLQRMRSLAAGKHNHVTIQDILGCFPGMNLTRQQITLIYNYADEMSITIDDYQPHDTRSVNVGEKKEAELTGEEKAYFKMYLEDLEMVEPCSAEEAEMLLERLMNGEDEVINRLTEGHLHMVLDIARGNSGHGVLIGDLVQEGNVALMMALQDLTMGGQLLAGGLREYLKNAVDRSLKNLIGEQEGYEKAGSTMAKETNRLLTAALELEDELGREASLQELSEKVGLPEDQVQELIKVSLDAAEFANNDDNPEEEN